MASIILPLSKAAEMAGEEYLAHWKHYDYIDPRGALSELLAAIAEASSAESSGKDRAPSPQSAESCAPTA